MKARITSSVLCPFGCRGILCVVDVTSRADEQQQVILVCEFCNRSFKAPTIELEEIPEIPAVPSGTVFTSS